MLDNSGINCYLSNIIYQKEWTWWGHFPSFEASLSETLRCRQNRPALRDHHLPFSLRSLPLFLLPHISSLMSLFPPLPPPASWGPSAGGAITEGGIDSFAVMWFGLQRGTAQSNTLFSFFPSPPRQRARLLSLPCLQQFMCFQTGQSTPLRYAGLSFLPLPFSPLPPSASHNLCSQCVCKKKKEPPILLSHTHTPLSLMANSNGHIVLFFTAFIFI